MSSPVNRRLARARGQRGRAGTRGKGGGGTETHGVEDAVDVERGVHEQRGVEDQVPDVAPTVRLDALAGQREEALGREGDVLLDVPGVVAGLGDGVEVREEGIAASAQLERAMTS